MKSNFAGTLIHTFFHSSVGMSAWTNDLVNTNCYQSVPTKAETGTNCTTQSLQPIDKEITMISKKMMTIAMTVILIASTVLSITAQPQRGGISASPANLEVTADLEVTIEAFENSNGTGKISNGGLTSYSGGGPKNYVRFTIKNKGPVKAENFTYKMVVRCNGLKVYDPPAAQLSLNPGETKTFPLAEVVLASTTNDVQASILANIGKLMKEANMTNNKAEFKFTGKVVH